MYLINETYNKVCEHNNVHENENKFGYAFMKNHIAIKLFAFVRAGLVICIIINIFFVLKFV